MTLFALINLLVFGPLMFALCKKYFKARSKATKAMDRAQKEMFSKWNTLLDASDDVPDELLKTVRLLLGASQMKNTPFVVYTLLCESLDKQGKQGPSSQASKLRDPLKKVYFEFMHAWLIYVSNRNLLARALIRQRLGREVERQDHFDPVQDGLVKLAATKLAGKVASPHCANLAA